MISAKTLKIDVKDPCDYPWYRKTLDFICKYSGYNEVSYIVRKVKRILEWAPILWNDFDFDGNYMFTLMRYKAQRVSDCITRNDFIVDEEQEVVRKSIRVFNKLLARFQDEDWHHELQDNILERKWGKKIRWVPCKYSHDKDEFSEKGKDGKVIGYRWMGLTAPEEVLREGKFKAYEKDKIKSWHRAGIKQHKDLEKALEVLKKYHQQWWD